MILEKQEGYSRLIYLSCIDEPRTRMDLTREWGMSESGRHLYRESVKETLGQMRNRGFIEQTSKGIKSSFNRRIENYLEQETGLELNNFTKLLRQTWVRKNIFSLENIKSFYGFNSETHKRSIQRNRVMFIEPFQVFILAKIIHERNINQNSEKDILANLLRRNIFYGNLNHNQILDSALEELDKHSDSRVVRDTKINIR